MTIVEAVTQFVLAGGSVVLATYIGRRAPYLGALVLVFPAKVILTLIFLPAGDKQVLSEFLLALVPGLVAVAAFALAMWAVLHRVPLPAAFFVGLAAWAAVAGGIFVIGRFGVR